MINISDPTLNRLRNGALAFVCIGLLFGAGPTVASADPTLTPVPEPRGQEPIPTTERTPAGESVPGVGTCFSCGPSQAAVDPAAPGSAPNVAPVFTHTNSGADHVNLTVDGAGFTPNKPVHVEVRPDHNGDFDPYITDRGANQSGAIHVEFYSLQTVSPHDRNARGGYVVATDTTTQQSTPPLAATIFPPVVIDHG